MMRIRFAAAVMLPLFAAACSSTPITFEGPPGSVLFVNGQPHHLPSQVEFYRPAGTGQSNRYDIALAYNGPTGGTLRAKGFAEVYGYTESDLDKAVTNTCTLSDDQLAELAGGKNLVYKLSTSSKQPLATFSFSRE